MILTTKLRTLLVGGAFAVAAAGSASAAFINTGWEYVSNWDALTASYFNGVVSSGTWSSGIAPTSGWNSVTKNIGAEDNASYIAADKAVELIKTSGGHYAAGMGLYAWMGATHSTFNFNVTADVSGWESVIFQQRKGPNPDISSAAPVLVVGTERYAAFATEILFSGSTWVDAIGQDVTIQDIAYQWDLRNLDLSGGFTIEYEVAIHESLVGYQIAGTENFAVVVPEPSTYAMLSAGAAMVMVAAIRRRRNKA